MGFIDKVKGYMGVPDDEENYEGYDDYPAEQDDYEAQPAQTNSYQRQHDNYVADDDSKRSNKVVNINSTMQLQVVLVKPERFDDASQIADHLNAKRTVVLNLESTSKEVSRRLVDFLSGVAYANNGQIKRIANSTFIITPYNVGLMGDLIDELENNGVFFG